MIKRVMMTIGHECEVRLSTNTFLIESFYNPDHDDEDDDDLIFAKGFVLCDECYITIMVHFCQKHRKLSNC